MNLVWLWLPAEVAMSAPARGDLEPLQGCKLSEGFDLAIGDPRRRDATLPLTSCAHANSAVPSGSQHVSQDPTMPTTSLDRIVAFATTHRIRGSSRLCRALRGRTPVTLIHALTS